LLHGRCVDDAGARQAARCEVAKGRHLVKSTGRQGSQALTADAGTAHQG
jgi:hypothetical protein